MDRICFVLVIVLATSTSSVTGADFNEHCNDPIICKEKPSGYDSHMKNMVELYEKNKKLIHLTSQEDSFSEEDISGVPQGDDNNCWSITTVETPYAIKSHNTSTSHLVVQLNQKFVQTIRYTRCLYEGEDIPCFVNIFGRGSEARCKEKMAGISLYVYDPDQNAMVYKMFEVPVSCACKFPN